MITSGKARLIFIKVMIRIVVMISFKILYRGSVLHIAVFSGGKVK